jgi:ankyrin repeat protein
LPSLRQIVLLTCVTGCALAFVRAAAQSKPDSSRGSLYAPIEELKTDPQWRVYAAVVTHDHKTLQALLDGGDSPNRFSHLYRSPLVTACQMGDMDAVEILINRGAKIDIFDNIPPYRINADESALTSAIESDHIEVIQYLLAHGAQVNLRGPRTGETPLFVALRARNRDILNLLLQAHADISVRNNDGYTPLMVASMNNDLEMVEFCKARGAKFDSPQNELLFAASHGDVAEVQRLLNGGAAVATNAADSKGKFNLVNTSSRDGFTPLIAAASQGQTAAVKVLIAAGANLDSLDSSHDTALLLAIRNGHKSTILALLDAGADPKILNGGGSTTLLQAALYMDDPDVVERLIGAGVSVSSDGIERDGRPNTNTPLMTAAFFGRIHTVQILLDAHADVNARRFGGETALMDAASAGQAGVVALLLRAGADPSIKDKQGRSALDFATETSQTKIVEMLKKKLAPPASAASPPNH